MAELDDGSLSRPDMDEHEWTYFQRHVTYTAGISHGVFLAEGNTYKAAFCSDAEDYRKKDDIHLWDEG